MAFVAAHPLKIREQAQHKGANSRLAAHNQRWLSATAAGARKSASLPKHEPSQTPPAKRVRFRPLPATKFRHPIDAQLTAMMQMLRIMEPPLRIALRAAEQILELDNVSSGILVSENQLPWLHKQLIQACTVLDMQSRVPALYVRQAPSPNAYTLAVQGRRPFIVIHSSLLELLTEAEIQAVIAHELGHLKCEHGVWTTVANLLVAIMPMPALADMMQANLMRWQRAAELSCDRAALLVVQDPRVVMSALLKLVGGAPAYADQLDVDAYLEQSELFDERSKGRFGKAVRQTMVSSASHPLPVLRVRELKRWADSNQYRSLLRSGIPL